MVVFGSARMLQCDLHQFGGNMKNSIKILSIFALYFLFSLSYADDFMVIDEPADSYTQSDQPQGAFSTEIGSVDTANQPAKGALMTEVNFYEQGGVESRIVVGIFDQFSIGVSERINALIGSETPILNIPSAFLKFSLFPQSQPLNLAIGFNRFAYGKSGDALDKQTNTSTQYGAFLATSLGYTLFSIPHSTTLGLRFPLLPDSFRGWPNVSLTFATQLRWKWFETGLTVENLYFDVTRLNQSIVSGILSFHLVDALTVETVFVGTMDGSGIHRLLNVKYKMQF